MSTTEKLLIQDTNDKFAIVLRQRFDYAPILPRAVSIKAKLIFNLSKGVLTKYKGDLTDLGIQDYKEFDLDSYLKKFNTSISDVQEAIYVKSGRVILAYEEPISGFYCGFKNYS